MKLEDIRLEIDRIDTEIKQLFLKRMDMSKEVANIKAMTGGDIYVPEREATILEKRAENVEKSIYEEYVLFLKQLINISRAYQYGILIDMQEETIDAALKKGGIAVADLKNSVTVEFACLKNNSNIYLALDLVTLCKVKVEDICITRNENELQYYRLHLTGDFTTPGKKRLLCQLAKEMAEFSIISL